MAEKSIYQLKVELEGSEPLIWRRIQVESDRSLAELHVILQIVMGWENAHLHLFMAGKQRYSPSDAFELGDEIDEGAVLIRDVLRRPRMSLVYEYDMGDSWRHKVTLERTLAPGGLFAYPVCTGGEYACPPEDCGGIWAYNETRDAYVDERHEMHDELLSWIGFPFNPNGFDTNAVNRQFG